MNADINGLPSTSHKTNENQQNEENEKIIPSSTNEMKPRKRKIKRFEMDLSKFSTEAKELQRREKERLERLDKNKKDFDIYKPMIASNLSTITRRDEENTHEPEEDVLEVSAIDVEHDDEKDDDLFIENVIQKKTDIEYIEVSSEDEDESGVNLPTTSSAIATAYVFTKRADLLQRPQFNATANWQFQQSQFQKYHSGNKNMGVKRQRRHSSDYDTKEMTAEGRLLINAGKSPNDPDVFVAEHLTQVLQPHQIGGVKFMYDNVIETLENFDKSDGNGCILAHSMGLGKTIQAITFIEIFIRVTKRNRVLIICPVNVLQNWNNEFEKWMPRRNMLMEDNDDGQNQQPSSIRDWEVFLLSDSTKTHEARVQLIDEWHKIGGVLLIGYEIFRLLIQQQENGTGRNAQNGRENVRKKAMSKRQKQEKRTVWDLEEGLAQLTEEDRRKMAEQVEMRETIRRALLSPGPDLVVCDEGHRIKNLNTEVFNALSAIYTKRRIVLTGYPLQNNLMEYYCMVDFVRPFYLGTRKEFLSMFEKPIRNGQCIDSTKQDMKLARQRIHVLTNLLRGFVQRRTQHLLKKILPESREYVLLLRKSPIQHALYRAFHHYAQAQELVGESSFNPLKGFAICMKIVNHPDLLYQAVLKKRKEQESSGKEENVKANIEENEDHKTLKRKTIEEEKEGTMANLTKFEDFKSSTTTFNSTENPSTQPFCSYSAEFGPQKSMEFGKAVHYGECSSSGVFNSSPWPNNGSTHQNAPFNSPLQFYPNQPTPIRQQQFAQQNGNSHFQQHHNQYFPPKMNQWNQNGGSYHYGGNGGFEGNFNWQIRQNQGIDWQNGQQNHQTFIGQNQQQNYSSSCQFLLPPQSYGPLPSNHYQMPHQNYDILPTRVPNYNIFQPPNYQQQRTQNQQYQFFQMPSTSAVRQTPPPTHNQYLQPQQNYSSHPTHFFNNNNNNGYNNGPNQNSSPLPLTNQQHYPVLNNGGTNFDNNNCNKIATTSTIIGGKIVMNEGRAKCNDSDGSNSRDIFKGTFLDNEDEQSQQSAAVSENGTNQQQGTASKTTQKEYKTKKRTTTKEVNDLLSDEFLLEDGSISFEWAEPGLKDYSSGMLENSSKLFIAMQIITETFRRGEKLLLFSQSVVTLNLIETFLKNQENFGADWTQIKFIKNKTYCRFDGTTTSSDREKLIKRFNEDPELRLFLISTKAGSLGVNLVSANRVIIFDVSWNPCHDAQAICRIYRYGQKRKTFIYRLIMGNSMEKQVFNRQISKQGLQKRVIDEQMIDANVTTREVQNLMEYDEALDVISHEKMMTKVKMKANKNGITKRSEDGKDDEFGLVDSLLIDLLETNGKWFMESMMLEREDGLSQEEKHEAELLYEREKRGINLPPAAEAQMQIEIESMNRRMGFATPLNSSFVSSLLFSTADGGHRLTQTAPFPKNLELATDMQKLFHFRHQQYLEAMRANQNRQQEFSVPKAESEIIILKEVTLPKVTVKYGDVPDYTVYSGQKMKMFTSFRGTYIRTTDNIVLDATKAPPGTGRFYKAMKDGRTIQQQNTNTDEVIQIDD